MKIGAEELLFELNGETSNERTLNSQTCHDETFDRQTDETQSPNRQTVDGKSFDGQKLNHSQPNPEALIAELRFKSPAGIKPHLRNTTQGTHAPVAETDETNTHSNVAATRKGINAGQADHANKADLETYIERYTNSRNAALARLAAAGCA